MKFCNACITYLQDEIDMSKGKCIKLIAHQCKIPEKRDGRIYTCFYRFINNKYDEFKKIYKM